MGKGKHDHEDGEPCDRCKAREIERWKARGLRLAIRRKYRMHSDVEAVDVVDARDPAPGMDWRGDGTGGL